MTARITDLTQARLSRRYAEMVADPQPFGQPRDHSERPRFVRPIPIEHYARIFAIPAHAEQDRIQQQLRDGFAAERMQDYGDMPAGVAVLERIGEALGSDNAFRCYVSFIAGSFFTLAMAYIWSVVLS